MWQHKQGRREQKWCWEKRERFLQTGGGLVSMLRLALANRKGDARALELSAHTRAKLQAGLWNPWGQKEETLACKQLHCTPWSLGEGGRASEGAIWLTTTLALGLAFKFRRNLGKVSGTTFSLLPRFMTPHSWAWGTSPEPCWPHPLPAADPRNTREEAWPLNEFCLWYPKSWEAVICHSPQLLLQTQSLAHRLSWAFSPSPGISPSLSSL